MGDVVIETVRRPVVCASLVTAGLLLIPALAMLVTNEVNWQPGDFLIAGALLFGSSLAFQLLTVRLPGRASQFASGLAVLGGLALIWVNLAVGMIGSEEHAANLLYVGVIIVGIAGAAIARLKPAGMTYALLATACGQILVVMAALIGDFPGARSQAFLLINSVFVALFLISAWLYRRSYLGDRS